LYTFHCINNSNRANIYQYILKKNLKKFQNTEPLRHEPVMMMMIIMMNDDNGDDDDVMMMMNDDDVMMMM